MWYYKIRTDRVMSYQKAPISREVNQLTKATLTSNGNDNCTNSQRRLEGLYRADRHQAKRRDRARRLISHPYCASCAAPNVSIRRQAVACPRAARKPGTYRKLKSLRTIQLLTRRRSFGMGLFIHKA